MNSLIDLLVKIYTSLGQLDTLTYEDYYRVQSRISKRIKELSSSLGEVRNIPYPNRSTKYIKNG